MNALGQSLHRFQNAVDRVLVLIAQGLLGLMVAITFVSVVGRTFFNWSVPDDMILAEFLMVALVFLPLGWVQSIGGHLEVTVLTDLFPKKLVSFLVGVGLLFGFVMFALMTYLSWLSAYESFVYKEVAYASVLWLQEWPVRMLIPFGLAWWCLRMLTHLLWPQLRPQKESEFEQALRETESYGQQG